jgi:hypothetical protein
MKRLQRNGQDRGQVKRLVILLLCAVVITADTIGGQFLRNRLCQKAKEHMGLKLGDPKRKRKLNNQF